MWALTTGLLFGLLILAHGAATWIFLSWLVFSGMVFRPRVITVLAALAGALIVVAPWLWRNHEVCGNPLGIAGALGALSFAQAGVGVPMVLISGRLAAERITGRDPNYSSRAMRG